MRQHHNIATSGNTTSSLSLRSQCAAGQLSGRPGGHRVDQVKRLRHLEAGDMTALAQIGVELGAAWRRTARDDEGLDALSGLRVGLADDGALRDAGMRQQRVPDFLAADLDAAGVDDVVERPQREN